MKLILFDDLKGGDKTIQIFDAHYVEIANKSPLFERIGFATPKDINMILTAELIGGEVIYMNRKRNIMKYITKLFQKRKKK